MDVKYTWILGQGKTFRQLRLQFPLSFIDQAVYQVRGGNGKDHNFSPLESSNLVKVADSDYDVKKISQ